MKTRAIVGIAAFAVAIAVGGRTSAALIENFQSAFRSAGGDLVFSYDFSGWDGGPAVSPASFMSPGANFVEFGDLGAGGAGSGLGTIVVSISRAASAVGTVSGSFHAYFDLEIDTPTNTYFNEYAEASGTSALGNGSDPDTFEIDEPGFVFGDIDLNFEDGMLDGTNGVPPGLGDDVAVAMGWDLSLAEGESATITLLVSDAGAVVPGSLFKIVHTDPDSDVAITYSGLLSITGGGGGGPPPPAVPEPGSLLILASGLAGMALSRRRKPKRT